MPKAAVAKPAVSRVYVVVEYLLENDATKHLVRAKSQAQAISHLAKGKYEAFAATVADVLELKDVPVQEAGSE